MKETEKKIADLQRLCERAHSILSENWEDYTDKDGYGPTSLLSDLQKVVYGIELRDLQALNDLLAKTIREQIETIDGMREIVKAVAHIGVDFGYGRFDLDEAHIQDARKIYESLPEAAGATMTNKLAELDDDIIFHFQHFRGHPCNCVELVDMASKIYPAAKVPWRIVDRRIQAMRKAGRISYNKKLRKWEIVNEK